MTIQELMNLGFQFCAGNIDRDNINYGTLTKDGPELTEEGKAYAEKLLENQVAAVVERLETTPKRRNGGLTETAGK